MFCHPTRSVGELRCPLLWVVTHPNSFSNGQYSAGWVSIQQLINFVGSHERYLAACCHQSCCLGCHAAGAIAGEHPTPHHLVGRWQQASINRCAFAKTRQRQWPRKCDAPAMRQWKRHHLVWCVDALRAARTSRSSARHFASGHGDCHGFGRLVRNLHY